MKRGARTVDQSRGNSGGTLGLSNTRSDMFRPRRIVVPHEELDFRPAPFERWLLHISSSHSAVKCSA
eukprot:4057049-Amphidinium_carterae.1